MCFAGNWPVNDAKWYFGFRDKPLLSPSFGYCIFNIEKDTIIDNEICSIMKRTIISPDKKEIQLCNEYLKYENQRVYRFVKDKFTLLYDFSLLVNDTFQTRVYSPSGIDTLMNVVIDSVSFLSINNDNHKMLYTRSINDRQLKGWRFDGWVIETIGNLDSFFPYSDMDCDAAFCFQPLRCYRDNRINFHQGHLACDQVYTRVVDPDNSVKMHYDRNTELIILHFDRLICSDVKIWLSNIHGQPMEIKTNIQMQNAKIDMSKLPKGIYVLGIEAKSFQQSIKLIK